MGTSVTRSTPPFPDTSQISLSKLLATAREASRLLGTEDVVVVRTVSIIDADRGALIPFATLVWVGDRPPWSDPPIERFEKGGLYFASYTTTTSELANPEAFARLLQVWIPEGLSLDVGPLNDTCNLYTQFSHGQQFGERPCWIAEVHRRETTTPWSLRQSPIVHPGAGLNATDAADATAQWLGDHLYPFGANGSRAVRVLVRDNRAYFDAIWLLADVVHVKVKAQAGWDYVVNVVVKRERSPATRVASGVNQHEMTFDLGGYVQRVDITLVDPNGNLYDHYLETPAGPGWAQLLPRPTYESNALDLRMGFGMGTSYGDVNQNMTTIENQVIVQGGSQVGVIGDNAHLQSVTLSQGQLGQIAESLDVVALLPELERLRDEMRKVADDPEHFEAMTEVARAAAAAKKGDRTEIVARIAKAGKWALNVAREIGVPVAVELLKSALQQ